MVLTAGLLAAPAAHAFTFENKDAADKYTLPKFDLEEQARNFRSGGDALPGSGAKREFDTPLGKGTLQFGVQQSPSYFGSGFGPGSSPAYESRKSREDFERLFVPQNMR